MGLKSPIPLKDLKFNTPVPYTLHVDRELFQLTKQKLALFRYPEEQTDFGANNWAQGAKVSRVKQLAEFWKDHYGWEAEEVPPPERYLQPFLVKIDVPGYGPLVLHFTQTNRARYTPLTEPEDAKVLAFHFVAPSIPGFGFSPAPTKSGVGPNVVARAYKILMTDVLRYPKFVTQGGDFGSFITRSIAIQYPQGRARPALEHVPSTSSYAVFEHESLRVHRNFEQDQSGYVEEQKTRPQTLGFALGDSPLGLLAWLVEKFHDWRDGATPGLRFYREAFGRGMREAQKTFETYVSVPCGVSMYEKEQLHCPRDWAAQAANILYWREYDRGGHFASLERPGLFVHDLRSFFSSPVVIQAYTQQ
ncbi:Alpha/Beta hydrolase protein [Aspergillus transmontanensis]|uniref:Alpha/Beta hydrolase protein n=1 Tax=Aspergillus transmontanensis TaxID=1034304 RepID=A0A5N6VU20_9EURO|nr:Alpha/Beta hydrolase protein [Aspergillus transmontanensis]